MLHFEFEESPGYWLTLSTQAYHRAFTEEMAPFGITHRQSQVLGWLALEEEMTQSQLAAKMLIEPPTLAGILDRMERCGWITRRQCKSDRRVKWISATCAAEPAWEKIVECAQRIRARSTRGLSSEQLDELKLMLHRIRLNMSGKDESKPDDAKSDDAKPRVSTSC